MKQTDKTDKTDKTDEILTGKKAQAIEFWRETRGHITNICRAVGIARQTYYEWLETDPLFKKGIEDAEAELNDDMREVLIQKGAEADLRAVEFYLKKRHPEFKEKSNLLNAGTVNFNQFLADERKKYSSIVGGEDE